MRERPECRAATTRVTQNQRAARQDACGAMLAGGQVGLWHGARYTVLADAHRSLDCDVDFDERHRF
ncbi:MAG: hypothetical protein ACJA1F_000703 [Paracoccaceae bacterium]|jgi:hypothetical protein